jgi:hypothetical protein
MLEQVSNQRQGERLRGSSHLRSATVLDEELTATTSPPAVPTLGRVIGAAAQVRIA